MQWFPARLIGSVRPPIAGSWPIAPAKTQTGAAAAPEGNLS